MHSAFPPVSWAHTAGLNEYRYDRKKAEDLLRSAGYARDSQGIYARSGVQLAFSIVTNRGNPLREGLLPGLWGAGADASVRCGQSDPK